MFCALADGVSAYPCDWKASSVSCEVAINFLEENIDLNDDPAKWLELAVEHAHQQVLREKGPCENMMAALILIAWKVKSNDLFFVNVGDTRLYCADTQKFKLCSKDDTRLVRITRNKKQMFDKHGQPEIARGVTKSIGQLVPLDYKMERLNFQPGSALFLCSDGAHGHGQLDQIWAEALFNPRLENLIEHLITESRAFTDDDASIIIIRRLDFPSDQVEIYQNLPESLPEIKQGNLLPNLVVVRIFQALKHEIKMGHYETIIKLIDYLETNNLTPTRAQIVHLMDLLVEFSLANPNIMFRLRNLVYKIQ